jgi:type II secretory pathway pseudopilin PulG
MQNRKRRAATLLEMLIAVVVIVLLALVAYPRFSSVLGDSNQKIANTNAETVANAANALAMFEPTQSATIPTILAAANAAGMTESTRPSIALVAGVGYTIEATQAGSTSYACVYVSGSRAVWTSGSCTDL